MTDTNAVVAVYDNHQDASQIDAALPGSNMIGVRLVRFRHCRWLTLPHTRGTEADTSEPVHSHRISLPAVE